MKADLRRWMFDVALPFWGREGVDPAGGYVEHFELDGRAHTATKRVRVICRQIYVFSHAAVLGWADGERLSAHGWRFLTGHAWLGPEEGWARLLDREGRVLDATPDLYDAAFALFACGWRHRASGDAEALAWAHRTLDHLDAHMRHPGGEGFLHERPARGPRQQNPHMHMLEAALVLLESSGEARFRDLADELVTLFARRFYDPATCTLAEFFDEDWRRAPGDTGRLTEPGHQFEWAWILANHQRLTGRDNTALVRGLIASAEAHGVDPVTGAVYNAVRDDGVLIDGGSRTWPNTERMKAAVALYEQDGVDPRPVLEASGRLLLDRYLAGPWPGAWIDAFDAEGMPAVAKTPTSTLYHVFLAFAEALRVL